MRGSPSRRNSSWPRSSAADGTISPDAEAKAIRWAVDHGARVINLSFGGMRDPGDRARDTYSPLEAAAVPVRGQQRRPRRRRRRKRGRCARGSPGAMPATRRRSRTWMGVSAVARDGSVPWFLNRDPRLQRPLCSGRGDPLDTAAGHHLERPDPAASSRVTRTAGRSSSAVVRGRRSPRRRLSAAAALVLAGPEPQLQPVRLPPLLTRTANDAEPDTGCERCWLGRDSLTGWGALRHRETRSGRSNGDPPRAGPLRGERRGRRPLRRALGPQGPPDQRPRSTTGTTRWTSTRSSFGAASAWWRGSAARAAPTRISSCGSPERDGSKAPRSIAACSLRSPRPSARSSEFACARRRDRLVLPRGEGCRLPGAGRYSLSYRKRHPRQAARRVVLPLATSRISARGCRRRPPASGTSRMTTAPAPT